MPFSAYLCGYSCDIKANQEAKGVASSYDPLVDLLELIENFLSRVDICARISPTPAIDEVVVKIMAELFSMLALATKELKQGRSSESVLLKVLPY